MEVREQRFGGCCMHVRCGDGGGHANTLGGVLIGLPGCIMGSVYLDGAVSVKAGC